MPAEELADRCNRTLDRAMDDGPTTIVEEQRAWLDEFWAASDVEIRGDDAGQQAVRWNIFQLAQASAQTQEHGIAAKGVTGGGYEGHYFWDTETYVIPFLAYTSPERARKALRFRWRQLPQARQRAIELNQVGALYPWRTITGEEASAYYAAGTAQYHINAAIAFALKRYLDASGDIAFLAGEAAEMLVETARLWEDLGFYATNGEEVFRIHGVTGPDEYTTVVNDNFYTNVMARFNMRYAARVVESLQDWDRDAYDALARRVGLRDEEIKRWVRASDSMYLPYDEALGINPQDDTFLSPRAVGLRQHAARQVPAAAALPPAGDLPPPGAQAGRRRAGDGAAQRPVPARPEAPQLRLLRPDHHRRLVAVGVRAGDGGGPDRLRRAGRRVLPRGAVRRPRRHPRQRQRRRPRRLDAAASGARSRSGSPGCSTAGPRCASRRACPSRWEGITFHMQRHGSRLRVEIDADGCTVEVLDGHPVPIEAPDRSVVRVDVGERYRVPRQALPE